MNSHIRSLIAEVDRLLFNRSVEFFSDDSKRLATRNAIVDEIAFGSGSFNQAALLENPYVQSFCGRETPAGIWG